MSSLTRHHSPLDISVQGGTRNTAVQGRSILASTEMTALAPVHVRTVQFTLVHSLILTQTHGNMFGGTYRAPGRETKDVGMILMDAGTFLHEGESFREEGRLVVPAAALPTLRGKLATSVWSIRTRVSGDFSDVVRTCPLTVLPDSTITGTDSLSHHAKGDAGIRFTDLTTYTLHPGVAVAGQVHLGSRPARTVTISLVMQEEVLYWAGQHPNAHDTSGNYLVEETVVNEQRLPRAAAAQSAIPFSFTVPAIPAPTVTSPQLKIRWLLRAALNVPFHRDLEAYIPMTATTSPKDT